MATIFNMYKDVASPDVTADIRESRRESEANTRKTQETAFGAVKRANIEKFGSMYRANEGRFKNITDPDKKFQVYYDALKALDPQAAQEAAKVYGEERQRRINREIADAYDRAESSGNPEIDNLRKYIESLKADIASTEALEATREQKQAQDAMQGYTPYTEEPERVQTNPTAEPTTETQPTVETPTEAQDYGYYNPSIDTGRMNQPFDRTLTPDEGMPASELQQDWSKLGYVPLPLGERQAKKMTGYAPKRLENYYTTDRKIPAFDISLSTEGTQGTDQVSDPRNQPQVGTGMEGYIPASRYEGYVPMSRSIANFYRGI